MTFRISACLLILALAGLSITQATDPALAQPGDKEFTNSIDMKLVLIPAGKFVMGSPPTEGERAAEEFQHAVVLTRPFYLGAYEVTQGQFERVTGKNPSFFNKKNGGTPDHPVEQVRWGEAVEFCRR